MAIPVPGLVLGLGILAMLVLGAVTSASAGQKELMEAWEARQQDLKDKIYDRLHEEGKLPEDGTVYFKARTRRDPTDEDKLVISVDEVQVVPRQGDFETVTPGKEPETAPPDAPESVPPIPIREVTVEWEASMDVSDFIKEESLDIPMLEDYTGRFEIRRGVVMPADRGDGAGDRGAPSPDGKGWSTVGPNRGETESGVP